MLRRKIDFAYLFRFQIFTYFAIFHYAICVLNKFLQFMFQFQKFFLQVWLGIFTYWYSFLQFCPQSQLKSFFVSTFQTRILSKTGDYGWFVPNRSVFVRGAYPGKMASRQMRYLVSKSSTFSRASRGRSICTLPWHFRNGYEKTKRLGAPMSYLVSHTRLNKYRIENVCDIFFALKNIFSKTLDFEVFQLILFELVLLF